MESVLCQYCNVLLSKDIIALNKKLLGHNIQRFMCLSCLADYWDCSEEDLIIKIDEFKEQGCTLFQ